MHYRSVEFWAVYIFMFLAGPLSIIIYIDNSTVTLPS